MPVSYFRMLCEKYPYVAVSATGTIESSKWTRNKQALKQIIRIGHSYGTKLHGLGYTRLENINKPEIMFDSVDSTAWLSGARFGTWYYVKHGKLVSKNTAIFITIAFYGAVPNIVVMILSQYLIKFIYAALDTPFFYFLTRNSDKQNI